MKAIFWDSDGFVIWYKRLERGTWQIQTRIQLRLNSKLTNSQ